MNTILFILLVLFQISIVVGTIILIMKHKGKKDNRTDVQKISDLQRWEFTRKLNGLDKD